MNHHAISLSFLLLAAAATAAEAKRAKCWVGMVADHSMKQMTFRLDASTYPFVFDVNSHDPNGTKIPDYREMPLYEKGKTDAFEGHFLSRVIARDQYDGKLSAYTLIFGELHLKGLVESEDYTLYVDWPNNKFTWVDGMIATYSQSEPQKYTYPARCERLD
ncbi:hypothetical protein [Rhizobium leguminosarum]|uniref:hypothetical protein n=1 Tax=Rhizobium leguminosarum TaxID=384 RepID=UPI001C95D95A|nr:hypothetical protein [Rhizobium leguminosarum]MBY5329608.1 hypothetical protein [Rhizobium leguminosarum]